VAFGGETGTIAPVHPFKFGVAFIEGVDDVGGSAAGFAGSNVVSVEDDDGLAIGVESLGGEQTGDTCPDDADIGLRICDQRRVITEEDVRPHGTGLTDIHLGQFPFIGHPQPKLDRRFETVRRWSNGELKGM